MQQMTRACTAQSGHAAHPLTLACLVQQRVCCSTIQQFRDQGMHSADINQLRGFVAGGRHSLE